MSIINFLPYLAILFCILMVGSLSYLLVTENRKILESDKKYKTPFYLIIQIFVTLVVINFCRFVLLNNFILPNIDYIGQLTLLISSLVFIYYSQKISTINPKIIQSSLLLFVGISLLLFI
jgi:hypothetical protein